MTMKKLTIKLLIIAIFFNFGLILSFSGCSQWQGDLAKIVISLGGSERAVYDAGDTETHNKLNHEIILTSATEKLTFKKSGTTFEAYVMPGNWTILIHSYLDGEIYATGSKDVILKLGQDNVETVDMYQAHLVKFDSQGGSAVQNQIVRDGDKAEEPPKPVRKGYDFDGWYADKEFTNLFNFSTLITDSITLYAKWSAVNVSGENLAKKLEWLNKNAVDGGNYIVTVNENGEDINSGNRLGYGKKVSITLTGGTVNLKNTGAMFNIDNGVTLILKEVTLKGLDNNNMPLVIVEGYGKLVMNEKSAITGNCNYHDNHIGGGGVFVSWNGNFEMNAGAINNNKIFSGSAGGGVFVWGGTFVMNGGEIFSNESTEAGGGGVFVMDSDEVNLIAVGTFTMNGGKIENNKASWGGGVFVAFNGTFTMSGGKISGNTSYNNGGGVYNAGTFIITDGEISGNKANNCGGGVDSQGELFTMNGGEIKNNTAQWGGGVFIENIGTFTMSGGKIYDNTAALSGGGVNVYGSFTMSGGTISGNTSSELGGGVNVQDNGTFTMKEGAIISDNTATNSGGGVYVSGPFTMSGGEISGNKCSESSGGGVYVFGPFTMSGGTISGNTAEEHGGGVFVYNNGSTGTFTKTKGIIYGLNEGSNSNIARVNENFGSGHAVYVLYGNNITPKFRNKTAGEDDILDSSDSEGWGQ